jgi:hypothetical protein
VNFSATFSLHLKSASKYALIKIKYFDLLANFWKPERKISPKWTKKVKCLFINASWLKM